MTSRKALNPLEKILAAEYQRYNTSHKSDLSRLDIFDFLTTASPHFRAPEHLAEVLPYLEAIEHEPQAFTLTAPPRHGKALRDDTPIATHRGWLRADEIVVGDLVYGRDGKFTTVTGVFPQGDVDLYKVSFSDASSLTTCAEHQWSVRQRYYDKWYTKTTAEIATDLTESDGRKKWRIPVVTPVEGLPSDLPVDPYILGVWLGDGTTRIGAITSMDDQTRDYLDVVYPITRTERKPDNFASTYYSSTLHHALRDAGLLKNKHVPDAYKTAPVATRLAVLQGLADTDGTVAKNGSQQSICTTLPRLKDDIAEIVCSLGGTYTIVEKPTYAKLAYNIYFRLPDGLEGFRLVRKQSRLSKPSPKNRPRRFIESIEPVGRGFARCFSVSAPDHLYCAGRDYVVTHNSVLVNHFVARHMIRHPGVRVAYGCYSLDLSMFFSEEVKDILTSAGVEIDRAHNSKEYWKLSNGSSFKAVAPGSGFTGRGADLIIIDDPYKGRTEAESGKTRETTWNWFAAVAITRRSPNASVILTHTRWNVEDLIGIVAAKHNWPGIALPAIDDSGQALWPSEWSVEKLQQIKAIIGEYEWSSLYMGNPLPRGGAVFGPTHTYKPADFDGDKIKRTVIGIDLAYTKKVHADYSVAVVLSEGESGNFYIRDVRRKQCEASEFAGVLRELRTEYNSPPIYWSVGGTEKAVAELFRNSFKIPVKDIPAKDDKFVRSQAVAARWNAGKVLMPSTDASWSRFFLAEVLAFSGLDDPHDDCVDALAAAFIPFAGKKVSRGNLMKNPGFAF